MRRLRLLGPTRIDPRPESREGEGGDAAPRFRSRRTRALLGYLVAEARPVGREHLALLFWPDEIRTKGRANLRRELHNLSQILPGCWELDRQAAAFVPANDLTVDLYQLPDMEARERWNEAAELLGGEFLEGLFLDDTLEFENWLLGERERWRERAVGLLRRAMQGHARRGHYTDALRHVQRLLQLAPWDEAAHRDCMRFLAWTGQPGAAVRQYDLCTQALRDELALEPDPETQSLYRHIGAGDLELPPQLPAFLTGEKPRHPYERPLFVGRLRELAQLDVFLDEALAGRGRVVFVTGDPGRGKTALLAAFAQQAMEDHPNLLVANGDCNAYSGVGDPYLPYRDIMAMLTGDVEGRWDAGAITADHALRLWDAMHLVVEQLLDHGPHLFDVLAPGTTLLARAAAAGGPDAPMLARLRDAVRPDLAGSTGLEQSALYQQVTNVLFALARSQPLLLVIDDLQWADAASVSLLFHLGRRLQSGGQNILIACAYRPEEVALGRAGERHPLAQVLSEFRRIFGDVWVRLEGADATAGREFVDAFLDAEANRLGKGFRSALLNRTGGHPLFTLDLLRAMQNRGDMVQDEDGAWVEGPALDWNLLPARVEAVIGERLDRLEPELHELLTVASVEGEVFTAQVLAHVRGESERSTLRQLAQGLERRHRLVREQEAAEVGSRRLTRYRFGHALFQEVLYGHLGRGERQLLHREVAGALEMLFAGQTEAMAVHLAHHYDQAGDHHAAFHYTTLAAERAVRLLASDEAIAHYSRAIQLAERVSPDADSLVRLHRGRGWAYERQGAFDQAHADYMACLEIADGAGQDRVAWRAHLDLGKLWSAYDLGRARDYYQAALDQARLIGEPAPLAGSLNWMGNWHLNSDQMTKAVAYHQEALEIFEGLEDRPGMASTLDLLGIANLMGGNPRASVAWYDRAIALYRELGNRQRLASSLMGRSATMSMACFSVSVPVTPPFDPLPYIEEGLKIARQAATLSEQYFANWSLGHWRLMQGDYGGALELLEEALRRSAEVGHHEWMVALRFSLGYLHLELLAPRRAQSHLENALSLAQEMHSTMWARLARGALARAHLLLDDRASARTHLEPVIKPETPMDSAGRRTSWLAVAEIALTEGEPGRALDVAERLIASAHGMQAGHVITALWKLKADAMAAAGRMEEAHALLEAALENAHKAGERFLLWRFHASLGRLEEAMGRQEAAEGAFTAAREQIDELAATLPDQALKEGFRHGAHRILTRAAS